MRTIKGNKATGCQKILGALGITALEQGPGGRVGAG